MIERFYYKSQVPGDEVWTVCEDEETCLAFAKMGYEVRKVVYDKEPEKKQVIPDFWDDTNIWW